MWSLVTMLVLVGVEGMVVVPMERGCEGSTSCTPFTSCTSLQGEDKQALLTQIRRLSCGFSGLTPLVCCPSTVGGRREEATIPPFNHRSGITLQVQRGEEGGEELLERRFWSQELGPK